MNDPTLEEIFAGKSEGQETPAPEPVEEPAVETLEPEAAEVVEPEVEEPEAVEEPEPVEPEEPAEPVAEEPRKGDPTVALRQARAEAKAERAARVALEERIAALERPQTSSAPIQKPEAPKAPDFLEEPERLGPYIDQSVAQVELRNRVMTSRMVAAQAVGADKVEAAWKAAEQADASVADRILASDHPALEAVKWHEERQFLAEAGDLGTYEQRLREQWEAEQQATQQAAQVVEQVKAVAPPAPSLAKTPNMGNRNPPKWAGPPESLEDVYALVDGKR